jgi:hypothetical protein
MFRWRWKTDRACTGRRFMPAPLDGSEPSGGRMQSQVMHVAMLALGAMIIIWLVAEVTSRT